MTTERVEAITEAVMALAQHLADCSSEEREAIGQRIADNFHGFELLQIYLAAAAGRTRASKGD